MLQCNYIINFYEQNLSTAVANLDHPLDLSNEDILSSYLEPLVTTIIPIVTTSTTNDDTALPTGAIAGIVIAAIVVVTSVTVIVFAVGIYLRRFCHFHRYHKQSSSM